MTLKRKHRLTLTLLAALILYACNRTPELTPINPNSEANFGIHSVLHNANGAVASALPERFVLGKDVARHTDSMGKPLFIKLPPIIDKSCLDSIQAIDTEYGGPALSITLTPDCAKKFGRFTAQNIGKKMALTINDDMVTAPYIRATITGGGLMIEGDFNTLAEAETIARQFH